MKYLFFFVAFFLCLNLKAQDSKNNLPFYFPAGVQTPTDPVKKYTELVRSYVTTRFKFQPVGDEGVVLFRPSDCVKVETALESTSAPKFPGEKTKMVIVLDHFYRIEPDKIRVDFLDGEYYINNEQLQVIIDDLVGATTEASNLDYEFVKGLSAEAINIRIQQLGLSDEEGKKFRKNLDEKIPDKNITWRQLNRLPEEMSPSSFVPRELHLAVMPKLSGVLGLCYMNTGIIYYNPQARIRDYIMGTPAVLQHEMVHNNIVLQRIPLSSGFDVELFASIPETLEEDNPSDLISHQYMEDLRECVHVIFGFDYDQVRKNILKWDYAGNRVVDEEAFRYYIGEHEKIKVELMKFFKTVVLPTYYTDPWFMGALHDKMQDQNALLKILFVLNYNPTILGGEKETATFLAKNSNIIEEASKKAFEKSAEGEPSGDSLAGKNSLFLKTMYESSFSLSERKLLEKYFSENPEALKKLQQNFTVEDAFSLLKILKNSKGTIEIQ